MLSYADLYLWNWTAEPHGDQVSEGSFYDLKQLKSLVSFTEQRGEDAFYHVPAW